MAMPKSAITVASAKSKRRKHDKKRHGKNAAHDAGKGGAGKNDQHAQGKSGSGKQKQGKSTSGENE